MTTTSSPPSTPRDSNGLPHKPITRPPSRARSNARQNLATALVERHGHDPASATAIARAVVEPSRVRAQLNAPIDERVPGGTLHMIHTDVWPTAVSPSPINPRAAGDRVYPAGASRNPRTQRPRRPLVVAGSDPNGAPVLTLPVDEPEHLVHSLQDSMNVLMSTAEKLIIDLPEQGVMRPVTVVPMRVEHADGSPTVTLPTTPDGSSRTTIVWGRWGLQNAAEVYNIVDDRRLGERIAKVDRLASKDGALLTDDERVLLRLATIPAEVIIGFTPDAGSSLTFAKAVEAWVADIHIDPPRPWEKSADLDTKATAIVESFADQMDWTPEYIDYVAGNLTPDEAVAAGFGPTSDMRAVEVLAQLGDDRHMTVLNDGLRRLGARKPHRPERLEPLVELMLRPFRGTATPAEITVARTILSNLRGMADWNRPGWIPSGLDLDDLYRAAEDERSAAEQETEEYEDTASAGPHARELGFMAAVWLARHGSLRRQTRGSAGGDDREPEHLLRELMTSEYGLKVLRHIIVDGRAGRAPRAIDDEGQVAKDATGTEILISTTWLKFAFPTAKTPTPQPGAHDYTNAVNQVRHQVDEVESAVKTLVGLKAPSGDRLARSLGVKPQVVDGLKQKLTWASDQLTILANTWSERHEADEFGLADETDEGGE